MMYYNTKSGYDIIDDSHKCFGNYKTDLPYII